MAFMECIKTVIQMDFEETPKFFSVNNCLKIKISS